MLNMYRVKRNERGYLTSRIAVVNSAITALLPACNDFSSLADCLATTLQQCNDSVTMPASDAEPSEHIMYSGFFDAKNVCTII